MDIMIPDFRIANNPDRLCAPAVAPAKSPETFGLSGFEFCNFLGIPDKVWRQY